MPTQSYPDIVHALLHPQPDTPVPLAANRRIRIVWNGEYICDTTYALLVWEHPYYPQYYIPGGEITKRAKADSVETIEEDGKEVAERWVVKSKKGGPEKFELLYFKNKQWPTIDEDVSLNAYVRITFSDMDFWFEEDAPIFVHPKDPYKRLYIFPSSRTVKVEVEGVKLAESSAYWHLHESILPVRYYMPLTSIDLSLLRPSKTITQCPYKGDAEYFDVVVNIDGEEKVFKDLVWWYRLPTHECAQVAGMACFYNEKVDIWMDGVKLPRPKSKFS